MIYILAGLSLLTFGLAWLVLHFIKQATKANERADYNEATAKEIQKQAGILNEHITPDDLVKLLRKKAADQRECEAKGQR